MLTFYSYDVFTAFRILQPPEFPLLEPTSHYVDKFHSEDERVSRMCQSLQALLPKLPSSPQFIPLKSILQDVIAITLAYEKYEVFEPSAPILRDILMARHCVLHDLLTVGDAEAQNTNKEVGNQTSDEAVLYGLTWLSALSYMLLDLYPITRGPGPHELLAERLHKTLVRTREQGLDFCQPLLYQWAINLLSRLNSPTM